MQEIYQVTSALSSRYPTANMSRCSRMRVSAAYRRAHASATFHREALAGGPIGK